MSEEARYAVLIDAENISPHYVQIIFDEVSNYGITTYRRIYGDWTSTRNNRWKEVLLENSITPIQQYSYTEGKNSSDSAMIIDAMDILYTLSVDGFVLVSSDSDFTRLASRLRESGMKVIGMGESKTPKAFISACNTFKYLDILYDQSCRAESIGQEEDRAGKGGRKENHGRTNGSQSNGRERGGRRSRKENQPQPQTKLKTIRRALKSIIKENSDEDDWISLANLGNQLNKRFPDFDVRNYGFNKLAPFIESLNQFEIKRLQPTANSPKQLYVRNK